MLELMNSEIKHLAGWRLEGAGAQAAELRNERVERGTNREQRNEPRTNRERTVIGMRPAHGCPASSA